MLTHAKLAALFDDFAELGLAPATLARYLAALRGFAGFLRDTRRMDEDADPLRGLRLPLAQRYKPRALSATEVAALYEAAAARDAAGARGARRDLALLELLYGLGLRVSEAITLTLDALHLDDDVVLVGIGGTQVELDHDPASEPP